MTKDTRARVAAYYDLNPNVPNDIPFYASRVPSTDASILELGCGTGRVLVALAALCRFSLGIDSSDAMLNRCRAKLNGAGVPSSRASVELGDITNFHLDRTFDMIIAPYVFQSLATDAEIDGFLACARNHLNTTGTCVLHVFRPDCDPDALLREWSTQRDELLWETRSESGVVTCHRRAGWKEPTALVSFPQLIYSSYENGVMTDHAVLNTVMRCYSPEEFQKVILDHGLKILRRWGGFAGEQYGQGPELVVECAEGT